VNRRPSFTRYEMAAPGEPFRIAHQLHDDQPLFLDIVLLPCAEVLEGSRARKDLKPKVGKPGLYRRVGQCFLEAQSSEQFARGVTAAPTLRRATLTPRPDPAASPPLRMEYRSTSSSLGPEVARYGSGLKSASFRQTPSALARSWHLLCLVPNPSFSLPGGSMAGPSHYRNSPR
jgi:hypothetical protein